MPDALFPLLIFLAEVLHLTFGTIRVVFVSRGLKLPAAVVGFFEVLVFLFALGQVMQNLNDLTSYLAFAGGFATGSVVGLWIEEKIAMGMLSVQIITEDDAHDLVNYLRAHHFGVTSVTATGMSGKVRLLVVLIKRKHMNRLRQIVEQHHPHAFISVQDVRMVNKLYSPHLQAEGSPFRRLRGRLGR